jgi:hypothetical protein
MYYASNWWWIMSWIIPMLLLAWVAFSVDLRRGVDRRDLTQRRRSELRPESERPNHRGLAKLNQGRGPRMYTRSDARVLEDVCDQLAFDEQLDASGMEVDVDRGIVQLRGRVETRYDKRRAESIADEVLGVKDVQNKLEIGQLSVTAAAAATPSPHQIS